MNELPELRKDPVLDRWVIVARERGRRPSDFAVIPPTIVDHCCPFCRGSEEQTPKEILRLSEDGTICTGSNIPWQVRVIPNKYPALVTDSSPDVTGEPLFQKKKGIGSHEVVVETPEHLVSIPALKSAHMALVLQAYRHRIVEFEKDSRFKYVVIFKNHGYAAGASLEHCHSQIIALPDEPYSFGLQLAASQKYFLEYGRSVYSDIVERELAIKERVVCQNSDFVVLVPFAARIPFEMQVISKTHSPDFSDESDERMLLLSEMITEGLKRLDRCVPSVPFNLILNTGPLRVKGLPYYQYHIEILPKLTSQAGFEWGSGGYINPVVPEDAASWLREA